MTIGRSDRVLHGHEGSYALLDTIGKGAYGTVYKAIWRERARHVAIKRVSRTRLSSDEKKALQAEILLFQNLNHPHIVNYIETVDQPDSPFLDIVMEYVEGGSLFHMVDPIRRSLDTGKLVLEETVVAHFVREVVLGLQYLHQQGIVHRDIKGANILVTKDQHCKLADFGVSSTKPAEDPDTFDVAGSPYWMAPEIINLTGSSTASDIWSLGCTVIELLTGLPPYHQYADLTALFKIVNDDCPPLPPNLSTDCEDFLRKCFHKDAHSRPTADELLIHRWLVRPDQLFGDPPQPSDSSQVDHLIGESIPTFSTVGVDAPVIVLQRYEEDAADDDFDDLDGFGNFDDSELQDLPLTSTPPFSQDGSFADIVYAEDSEHAPLDVAPTSTKPCRSNDMQTESSRISSAMRSWSFREDPFKDVLDDPEVDRERERLRKQKELWDLVKMHASSLGRDEGSHVSACDELITMFQRHPEQRYNFIYDPGLLPIIEALESNCRGSIRSIEATLRVTLSFVAGNNGGNEGQRGMEHISTGNGNISGEPVFGYPRVSNIREDLCLAGFLPAVMQYCKRDKPLKLRLLAARFLDKMMELERVLHMFIACSGFSVFVDLLEPDILSAGELSEIALRGINRILTLDNQRHKRDFCRRLSWNGLLDRIVDGIAFNMERIGMSDAPVKVGRTDSKISDCSKEASKNSILEHITKLSSLLKTFAARADPILKANMTNSRVLDEMIQQITNESAPKQAVLSILCCIRDLSRDPQTHHALQMARTIQTLVGYLSQTRSRESSSEQFIISSLHNLCIVSTVRQEIAARAGVLPHLQRYIKSKDINVGSLCIDMFSGLGCAGHATRVELAKEQGVDFYVYLMVTLCGPRTVRKWQARVLQSMAEWLEDSTQVELVEQRLLAEENRSRVCESLAQVRMPELEGVLEPYLRMMTVSERLNRAFGSNKALMMTLVHWLEEMYRSYLNNVGSGPNVSGTSARGRLLLLRTLLAHAHYWNENSLEPGIIQELHELLTMGVLVREEAITVRKQASLLLETIDILHLCHQTESVRV